MTLTSNSSISTSLTSAVKQRAANKIMTAEVTSAEDIQRDDRHESVRLKQDV